MHWRRVLEIFIEMILLPMVITDILEDEGLSPEMGQMDARDMGVMAMEDVRDEVKFILDRIYVKQES